MNDNTAFTFIFLLLLPGLIFAPFDSMMPIAVNESLLFCWIFIWNPILLGVLAFAKSRQWFVNQSLILYHWIIKKINSKHENAKKEKIKQTTSESQSKKLHTYIGTIIATLNDIEQDSQHNATLIEAINDSINQILVDGITPANFLTPQIQAEKQTIFDVIAEHNLIEHIVFKRLQNLFAINETLKETQTISRSLREKNNRIFACILNLVAQTQEYNAAKDQPDSEQQKLKDEIKTLENFTILSINEIFQDSEIKDVHYQDALVKSDVQLMLAYLDENKITNTIIKSRLKHLFSNA